MTSKSARRQLLKQRIMRLAVAVTLATGTVLTGSTTAVAEGPIEVTVDAKAGWTPAGELSVGLHSISTTGGWTVDYSKLPFAGAEGYDPATDAKIYQGCKMGPWPYARLLGRIGPKGTPFSVWPGPIDAHQGDQLFLRINDADACLGDNAGYLTVLIV